MEDLTWNPKGSPDRHWFSPPKISSRGDETGMSSSGGAADSLEFHNHKKISSALKRNRYLIKVGFIVLIKLLNNLVLWISCRWESVSWLAAWPVEIRLDQMTEGALRSNCRGLCWEMLQAAERLFFTSLNSIRWCGEDNCNLWTRRTFSFLMPLVLRPITLVNRDLGQQSDGGLFHNIRCHGFMLNADVVSSGCGTYACTL